MKNLDKFIKNCKDYGFEPFFQFYISQAANVKKNPKQPPYLFDSINQKLAKGIDPYDAAYYQTWRNMFAMMFKRYNKDVQDWYIADEIYHSYSLSKYEVPHYINVLKILHEEVKKKDPSNMIGGGNTFMDRDPIGKKMWPDVKNYVDGLVCSLYLGSTTAGKGLKVTSPEEWGLLKSFDYTRSIIGKEKFLNELRYADEMVRHKILDLVGDLSLTGRKLPPLKITCACGGHKHNVIFAKILLANSEDK